MDLVSIVVKTPHYSVQAYNHTTGSWVSLGNDSAAVICENDTLSNGFTIDSCILHVAYPVDGHQTGLFQLTYDTNSTLYVEGAFAQTFNFTTDFENVTLNGYNDTHGHHLTVAKKDYN